MGDTELKVTQYNEGPRMDHFISEATINDSVVGHLVTSCFPNGDAGITTVFVPIIRPSIANHPDVVLMKIDYEDVLKIALERECIHCQDSGWIDYRANERCGTCDKLKHLKALQQLTGASTTRGED